MYNYFQKKSKGCLCFRTLLSGNTFWCRVIFLSLVNLLTFRQEIVEFDFIEQEMTFFMYLIPSTTDLCRHALWKKVDNSWLSFFFSKIMSTIFQNVARNPGHRLKIQWSSHDGGQRFATSLFKKEAAIASRPDKFTISKSE